MSDVTDVPPTQTPPAIVVNPSAVPAIGQSQLALFIAALGGVVSAFGLLSPTKWAAVAGVLPYLIVAAWRAYAVWQSQRDKVTMAAAAPDSVAKVKGQ